MDPAGSGLAEPSPEEIKVLVTGYGPFLEHYPLNSSWAVASTLPSYLPATATLPHAIRLIVPNEPIKVAWDAVIETVPKLLGSHNAEYDIILHMGAAVGRQYYTLEQQSFRDSFQGSDVDGKTPPEHTLQKLFKHCPAILKPTFDCQDIWRRWRRNLLDESLDVRCSDDPGGYLCGFVYYLSMSWFWKKHAEERPVAFLHVPDLPTESEREKGREVAVGLIRALVESRRKVGIYDPLKEDGSQITGQDALTRSNWDGLR